MIAIKTPVTDMEAAEYIKQNFYGCYEMHIDPVSLYAALNERAGLRDTVIDECIAEIGREAKWFTATGTQAAERCISVLQFLKAAPLAAKEA